MKTVNKIILFGVMLLIFIVLCTLIHNIIQLFHLENTDKLMAIQDFFTKGITVVLNGLSLLILIIVAKKINRELVLE